MQNFRMDDINEVLVYLENGHVTESDFILSLRELFRNVVVDIATKNEKHLTDYISVFHDILNGLSKSEDTELVPTLRVQVKEYLFMIHTYFQNNIGLDLLERISECSYSTLILDAIRLKEMDYEELEEKVLGENPTEEETLEFNYSLELLENEDLIFDTDEETFVLTERAENLFHTYATNKKMTNKYERVKRQQSKGASQKVDVELLDRLEKVNHSFAVLETFYTFTNVDLSLEDVTEETILDKDELEVTLHKLEKLNLISVVNEEDEEPTYMLLSAGKNVFKVYKKSKQYTNKYEKLKRKNK